MNDSHRDAADLRPSGSRPLFAGTLLILALTALGVLHSLPPEGLPADAAEEQFSEARARAVLTRILGDERPHPVGSPENAAVRARILTELRALGLEPEERPGFACAGDSWTCGAVVNVVARVPGRRETGAVLLSAHYDSVGAGPGAGDAGASVASIVEIARALLSGEAPERPVILLLNEGEEAGLLGARAFLEEPEAEEIFAVVNGEARGTTGPSAMFETGAGNAAFVSAWAAEVDRPVTNSSLYALYKLLPTDTDLTVYKAQGWPGLNFAFADGYSRYHTRLDDLAHLDPRTLQHHGDNILAAARALASLPDEAAGGGDAVWIDALSFGLVSWPMSWSWPLTVLALAFGIAALVLLLKRRLHSGRWEWLASLGVLAAILLPQFAGLGIVRALQALRGDNSPWTAHPAWATCAVAGVTAAVAFLAAALLVRRVSSWAWWFTTGLACTGMAAALVWKLPGASSLGIVPALALNAALLLACLSPRRLGTPLLMAGICLAAWPWVTLAHALHVMMGLDPAIALTLPVALAATFVAIAAPAGRGRWHATLAASLVGAVGFTGALLVPIYSADDPRHASLVHVESVDTREAFWLASNPSEGLDAALVRQPHDFTDWPWPDAELAAEASPAGASHENGIELEVLSRHQTPQGRRLELRLSSRRGAAIAVLRLSAEAQLRAASVAGIPRTVEPGERFSQTLRGLPAEGVELMLEFEGEEPALVTIWDTTPGLPPGGDRLLALRPATSSPIQDGDRSILYRSLLLP